MAKLVLILGGARSGKSRFAQELARALGGDEVTFVATAQAGDEEMQQRIEHHQQLRPATWGLVEAPVRVGAALAELGRQRPVALVDCLTLLVSNLLLAGPQESAERRVRAEVQSIVQATAQRPGWVIVVSGETGQGIVPSTPLGRQFRDLLGWANQDLAAGADAVYLMVAGRAIEVTSTSVPAEQAARWLGAPSPLETNRSGSHS